MAMRARCRVGAVDHDAHLAAADVDHHLRAAGIAVLIVLVAASTGGRFLVVAVVSVATFVRIVLLAGLVLALWLLAAYGAHGREFAFEAVVLPLQVGHLLQDLRGRLSFLLLHRLAFLIGPGLHLVEAGLLPGDPVQQLRAAAVLVVAGVGELLPGFLQRRRELLDAGGHRLQPVGVGLLAGGAGGLGLRRFGGRRRLDPGFRIRSGRSISGCCCSCSSLCLGFRRARRVAQLLGFIGAALRGLLALEQAVAQAAQLGFLLLAVLVAALAQLIEPGLRLLEPGSRGVERLLVLLLALAFGRVQLAAQFRQLLLGRGQIARGFGALLFLGMQLGRQVPELLLQVLCHLFPGLLLSLLVLLQALQVLVHPLEPLLQLLGGGLHPVALLVLRDRVAAEQREGERQQPGSDHRCFSAGACRRQPKRWLRAMLSCTLCGVCPVLDSVPPGGCAIPWRCVGLGARS